MIIYLLFATPNINMLFITTTTKIFENADSYRYELFKPFITSQYYVYTIFHTQKPIVISHPHLHS